MNEGIFLLGLGAQKCGTSWLHEMLNRSDQVDFGFAKEFHIHDALTLHECQIIRRQVFNRIKHLREVGENIEDYNGLAHQFRFLTDIDNYYDYLEGLLLDPKIRLTGRHNAIV